MDKEKLKKRIADAVEGDVEWMSMDTGAMVELVAELEAAERAIDYNANDIEDCAACDPELCVYHTGFGEGYKASAAALRTLRQASQREVDMQQMSPAKYAEKYGLTLSLGVYVAEEKRVIAALAAALATEGGK